MEVTARFGEFVADTSFDDFLPETIEYAKRIILKCIGAMLAGCRKEVSQQVVRYIRDEVGGKPNACVIGVGFRTSAEHSALALGTFAHAAELEDNSFPGGASDITLVPAVLALGDKLHSAGPRIIEAFVLGHEVQGRIAAACDPAYTQRGMGPLGFFGPMGAGAGCAKLLGLDRRGTTTAISLGATQAAGLRRQTGWMAHLIESGLAARSGVLAGLLAASGLTARPDVIETEHGFHALVGEGCDLGKMVADLGRPFFIHRMWIKKYPCCFGNHRQIDALLMLMREHKISYPQIKAVELEVNGREAQLCNRPQPRDVEDSMFSYYHVLAGAMLEGTVGVDTFTEEKLSSPTFAEARKKVKVIVHPEWPWTAMEYPAPVTVELTDGRKIRTALEQPPGGPQNPLSDEALVALFRKLGQPVLSEEALQRTVELVLHLERLDNVSQLMDILTFQTKRATR